jgi:hypothetical protein
VAVTPLFVASTASLKAKLRLTGSRAGGDTEAMIEEAVTIARQGFYRRLGATRITTILATALTDTPTSDAQVVRSTAATTEAMWVRAELMRLLPSLFQDASGDAQEVWNREAPFRGESRSNLTSLRKELMTEVEANLRYLETGDSEDESPKVQGGDIAPSTTPPEPFDTIFPDGIEDLPSVEGT